MEEVATIKAQLQVALEEINSQLQQEQKEKEVAYKRIITLENQLREQEADRVAKPGDRTQAFDAAKEALDFAESKEEQIGKLQRENDTLQEQMKQLKEDLDFVHDEKAVFENVNEELESLQKAHSSLQSQMSTSRLSDLSSINESALRKSEVVVAELEAERDILKETLSEKDVAMSAISAKMAQIEKNNTHLASENSGLTMQLEIDRSKSVTRVNELTSELERAWKQSGEIRSQMVSVSCQSEMAINDSSAQTVAPVGVDFHAQTDMVDIKYLNGQLLHKTRDLESAQADMAQLQSEVGELTEQLKQKVVEAGENMDQIQQLQTELAQNVEKLDQASRVHTDQAGVISEHLAQLEIVSARLTAEETKNTELLQNIQNLKVAMESFEKGKQEALAEMATKLSESDTQLLDARSKLEKAEAMFVDYQSSLETVTAAAKAVETEKLDAVKKLAEANTRIAQFEQKEFKEPAEPDKLTKSDMSALGICEDEYDVIETVPNDQLRVQKELADQKVIDLEREISILQQETADLRQAKIDAQNEIEKLTKSVEISKSEPSVDTEMVEKNLLVEKEEKIVQLKSEIEQAMSNAKALQAANELLFEEKHQLTNSIKEMEETNKNAVQNQVIYFVHVHG